MKKILKEVLSWTLHIVIAVVCGLAINIFILQPTQVQGISMESIDQNDRVIINKLCILCRNLITVILLLLIAVYTGNVQ